MSGGQFRSRKKQKNPQIPFLLGCTNILAELLRGCQNVRDSMPFNCILSITATDTGIYRNLLFSLQIIQKQHRQNDVR